MQPGALKPGPEETFYAQGEKSPKNASSCLPPTCQSQSLRHLQLVRASLSVPVSTCFMVPVVFSRFLSCSLSVLAVTPIQATTVCHTWPHLATPGQTA